MSESPKDKQKNVDIPGIAWPRQAQDPDQDFELAQRAMRILIEAGFQARMAGGCVRDRILGLRPKDYDIATDAVPDEVSRIFIQKSIKVVPTGIDHGTVTVVMAGKGIEITSLRRDVATDGRRAVVAFASSYREDAERRDFTMNALYEDLDGRVYDYFNGLPDLQQGILRFVGDPVTRIREDYLRILRLFRFWGRFGFQPAAGTLQAVQSEIKGLAQISQERITSELLALLAEDEIEAPLLAMRASGTLAQILPRLPEESDLKQVSAYKSIIKAKRAACRLAFLLCKATNTAQLESDLYALRLSNQIMQQILSLCAPPPNLPPQGRALPMDYLDQLEKIWGTAGLLEAALPTLSLLHPEAEASWRSLKQIEELWGPRRRAPVPLSGQDLIKTLAIAPGPVLGELLAELKRSFREGEWDSKEQGLYLARQSLEVKTTKKST